MPARRVLTPSHLARNDEMSRRGGGSHGPTMILLAAVALTATRAEIRAADEPPPPPSRAERRAPVSLLLDCAIEGNCQAVPPDRDTRNPGVAGYRYAYAPSLIREGNALHLFYCSLGVLTDRGGTSSGGGDAIRYTTSSDGGATWSRPIVAVKATYHDEKVDRDACDPCAVFFAGEYYIFYTSAYVNRLGLAQGAVQVARSARIGGPYLTYTERGNWEETPIDPGRIIEPRRERAPSAMPSYGAGQTAVVVKDGVLTLWYSDDAAADGLRGGERYAKEDLLFTESRDAIHWSRPRVVTIDTTAKSVDVKYDRGRGRFVMTWLLNHSRCARVLTSESEDGLRWGPPRTLLPPAATPRYANNLGVVGDRNGWLADRTFVAFAANDDQAAEEQCTPPAGTVPLTRLKFAAPGGDQYLLTQSADEAERVRQQGWTRLNVPGNVYAAPDAVPGLVPLHRFLFPNTGDHVFTISPGEGHLERQGYRDEGIVGYVFSRHVKGTIPLYRLYHAETGQHYYTTSRIEYLTFPAAWKREGADGYLVAPESEPSHGLWSLYRAEVDPRQVER